MTSYAPGPWTNRFQDLDPKIGLWPAAIRDRNGKGVGSFFFMPCGDDETINLNYNLVMAATDLLEACEVLLGMFDDAGVTDTKGYAQGKAAVAKARGNQ